MTHLLKKGLAACLLMLWLPLQAGEGMWLPLLLGLLNESEMQSMGLKIKAEDIYSVNTSSLKDAVVKFGNGCTGEIVSGEGLLLTNHHCGFGQIQQHSTVERDYLTQGYWALSRDQELTNPGLTVTFIIRIEDVTRQVLEGVSADMTEEVRGGIIRNNSNLVMTKATEGTHYKAEVKPFYYGNAYYMFVTEVFRDVRLVGAPPMALGNFGGDTDNWVWPRHTADFSVFRVYTGPDGKPADYSPDNIPLKPRHFFPVSLRGVNEGDFTMVYGFPARTQEYLTSYAVEQVLTLQDPLRIDIRARRLEIIQREMKQQDAVRIMYASKEKSISNAYKKWQGEVRGLTRDQAVAKKQALEAEFARRLETRPAWIDTYGSLDASFKTTYASLAEVLPAIEVFNEGGYQIELVQWASRITRAANAWEGAATPAEKDKILSSLREQARGFYKDFYLPLDQQMIAAMLRVYQVYLPADQQPGIMQFITATHQGNLDAYATQVCQGTALASLEKFETLLADFSVERLRQDPAVQLMSSLFDHYYISAPVYEKLTARIEQLQRVWMQGQLEVLAEKRYYPDANFTLRVAYGKMEGMAPSDAVTYQAYTTLDGVMEKYKPGDAEFDVPARLIELYQRREYGRYGQNGEMRVAFIASNHTSGGNSGSPVINGEGHLIGINFDRNWEGTMSDINYDIRQCRNISVDIRYVLFIMDKVAGAGYLLDEMKLVE